MSEKNSSSDFFTKIAVFYVVCLLLSNLIAGKIWHFWGSIALPSAVMLFPFTYILGDVFTEVYGFKKARSVIWLGFISNLFAVLIYYFMLALPYPSFWTKQEAFVAVFQSTLRILFASFMGYLFGEFSNSIILSKLKVLTEGKHLWVRTITSTLVGEALDSILFITISFWGTMDKKVLLRMILFQYIFKVLLEVLFTPITYIVIGYLKKKEGIDIYDENITYNILKG